MKQKRGFSELISTLGPGLLYAGAAVGVSHLVQSTKAGAGFGFSLIWVVLLANVIKYPFFEAGPRYATATGESLIEGYRRIGWLPLLVFVLFTLGTMLIIQSAVTIVTAGLAKYMIISTGIDSPMIGEWDLGRLFWGKDMVVDPVTGAEVWTISNWKLSARILLICGTLLTIGRYKLLDRAMKVIILILSVTTVFALMIALFGDFPKAAGAMQPFNWADKAAIVAVIIPLVGWMPAPIDIAIWHSVWTLEKKKERGGKLRLKDSLLDFRIGYWGTTVLAVLFVSLGALIIFGSGQQIAPTAGAFAQQLIDMYASALGEWARPVIAIAAFTTMFSTTLTCLDAFPRVLKRATELFVPKTRFLERTNLLYWGWITLVIAGTVFILGNHLKSMAAMVDLATTMSFLTAPVLAMFNYMAVSGKHMPPHARPGTALRYLSLLGLVFLYLFAAYFVYVRFF